MEILFKERKTTDYIQVTCANKGGMSFEELYKYHRRRGDFHVDTHYFLDRRGFAHEGRQELAVAGVDLEGVDDTLHILVDAERGLNDCQRSTLRELLDDLRGRYPEAKLIGEAKNELY